MIAACATVLAGCATKGTVSAVSADASDLTLEQKVEKMWEERQARIDLVNEMRKGRKRTVVAAPRPSAEDAARKAIEAEVAKAKRLADEAARKAAIEKAEAERRQREAVLEDINRKRRLAK